MVVVSISKSCHLHPAHKKHSPGAWGLEEREERWVSSCFLDITGPGLLCCGYRTGVGGLGMAEATSTSSETREGSSEGSSAMGSSSPSTSLCQIGKYQQSTQTSFRAMVKMVEAKPKLNPKTLTAPARAQAQAPWGLPLHSPADDSRCRARSPRFQDALMLSSTNLRSVLHLLRRMLEKDLSSQQL